MSNSDDVLVKVENVSKKFCRSLKRSMLYGMEDISRDLLHLPNHSDKLRKDEFWAVDDVSFEVKRGECLGIIGRNGAGKSTLLKMLNGIILPDKGKITIKGKVGALIEVGAGFHPMLTGRENVYVNGAILGMSKREIDKKFDEIVAFAELEEFIDMPVKHYSSGMYVRLGFAILAHIDVDVLIIDEALSVGDSSFQHKSYQRIKEFLKRGVTLLFVSHDPISIQSICSEALLLVGGSAVKKGVPLDVMQHYNAILISSLNALPEIQKINKNNSFGTREVVFEEIALIDSNNNVQKCFYVGQSVKLKSIAKVKVDVSELIFGFLIKDRLGNVIYGTNTYHTNQVIKHAVLGSIIKFEVCFLMDLGLGYYTVSVALANDESHTENYEWIDFALTFEVVPGKNYRFTGCSWLKSKANIEFL